MLSEEEKKAIEYYSNKEVSFSVDFDKEKLLKALGITEEDSFENHQIRIKTLLNLITKLQKENKEKDNNIEELKSRNKYLKLENEAYGKAIVEQDEKIKQKDKYIKHSEEITTEMNKDINKLLLEIKQKDKQIDLMGEVIFEKFKAQLVIEYGIENKEQFIKLFEKKIKE